ncbi:MAG: hypothetical protein RRA63_09325 [Candidatus Calescibacterium sp.]|nr:hypothetical protein [Candidatus Calescibacterium sp.]
MRNKIYFYILNSFITIFVSVFALAPRCKFLTETNKSKWPPPKILYKGDRGLRLGWLKVLCKNNRVYVMFIDIDKDLLFFIYDLREDKWHGPEIVGEKIKDEILLHNKESLGKKYRFNKESLDLDDHRINFQITEFDVDEEGRIHLFVTADYRLKDRSYESIYTTIRSYLIYFMRETDGRWEEKVFDFFPPYEFPIYPLESTGIKEPLIFPDWVSAFEKKVAMSYSLYYHWEAPGYRKDYPPELLFVPEARHIFAVKNEEGGWDLYDLAELLPEAKEIVDVFQIDSGAIGPDGNLYIVLWQGPTIDRKGVEVKSLLLKIDTKEKRLKWIRRMKELEMENVDIYNEPLAGVLDNFVMKVKGSKFYYANMWRGKIYLHSWDLVGDNIENIVWEFVGKIGWAPLLSFDVRRNIYLLSESFLYIRTNEGWIKEKIIDMSYDEEDICIDDMGYLWVFWTSPFAPANTVYYVRKKVE